MLGLKSTALKFGEDTLGWVGGFYGLALVLWTLAGFIAGAHLVFFFGVALVALQMAWQVSTLEYSRPAKLPVALPLQPRRGARRVSRADGGHVADVVEPKLGD